MSAIDSLFERDDLRALADVGFLALSHGLVKPAEDIFNGLSALRPQGEVGWVGRAMALLHRANVDGAVALLRQAPPSDAARTMLALALQRQGQSVEARAILIDVIATACEDGPRNMARDLLAAMQVP